MGAYNILRANVECINCKKTYLNKIQFKFGDTWQLIYEVGDLLTWGGNDIGKPNLPFVKVYGIAEMNVCPYCNFNNPDEYDIIVNSDIIKELRILENISHYSKGEDYCQLT